MPFQSTRQIQKLLAEDPPEGLALAHALRCFVYSASYAPDYTADPRWTDAIVPTATGEEVLRRVDGHPIPRPDLALALLGLFWFQDPLIDTRNSNLTLVRKLIEGEAKGRRLLWPMSHGRLLYDRYATRFPRMRDALTAPEWMTLLDGTPQGVHQAGPLVCGPLGIIDSQCIRHFPPSQTLALLHCPMLECRELHPVRLAPPNIPLVEGYRLLHKAAVELWTTRSRWEYALSSFPLPGEHAWQAFSGMPLFIGNCIVDEDRTTLVTRVLASVEGTTLRAALRGRSPESVLQGSAEKLADALDAETQLQLLLVLPDNLLKRSIDDLVWAGDICVPAGEVRDVEDEKYAFSGLPFPHHLQLSSLGIRARRKHPVLLLRNLIWNAYVQSGEERDLDWRLRKPPDLSSQDALMAYFRQAGPPTAIETLVLTSPRITKAVAQELATDITVPDQMARATLLWKLGFDLPREDAGASAIATTLGALSATVARIGVPKTDEERQAIRSAGVNAFVELEGVIDELVAYLAWLLASDHPRVTRFVYSRASAMCDVPGILGEQLSSGTETVRWSSRGNALGTCVRYLQELATWASALPRADRAPFVRAPDELRESDSDAVTAFPFRYIALWADANPKSLSDLATVVEACSAAINRGEIASVRNGLEHYREPHRFPGADRIRRAIEGIEEFVSLATKERLYPRMFWRAGSTTDSFRQTTHSLIDYRGDVFEVNAPLTVRGAPTLQDIPTWKPILIAPGNLFGLPNATLLLGIKPESAYSRYWNKYPFHGEESVFAPTEDAGAPESMGTSRMAAQQRVAAGAAMPRS